jgi:hypothetical protein
MRQGQERRLRVVRNRVKIDGRHRRQIQSAQVAKRIGDVGHFIAPRHERRELKVRMMQGDAKQFPRGQGAGPDDDCFDDLVGHVGFRSFFRPWMGGNRLRSVGR